MRDRRRGLLSAGTLLVSAVGVAACAWLGLEHPVSNDGADANSPNGANPGTTILTINASRSPLGVGDTASITGTVGGMSISNNGLFTATSSDPSVLFVGGTSMFARSVGTVSIDASYNGYRTSRPLSVTVHAASNGTSAMVVVQNTDPPVFAPDNVYVKAGSTVQFTVGATHNVTFDLLAGAPQDVRTGAGAQLRTFAVAGTFSFRCTEHGERGVVNVVP